MKKYAINLSILKTPIFFEIILQKSAVAVKYKFKDFYTYNGEPKNWKEEFLSDIHESRREEYKGEVFYIHSHFVEELSDERISYIFYGGNVYSFDNHFTDCPIFEQLISSNEFQF